MKLAMFLLKNQSGEEWTDARYRSVVETKEPRRIDLKNPLPVHITYLTAWADHDGTVNFRRDAYNRDGTLKRALSQVAMLK